MVEIRIIPESIQLLSMSDKEYFSDKYKGYISNSRLSLINPAEGGSFEAFSEGSMSSFSDSFELGSAVHAQILQPESYNISDIIKPGGKLGIFAEHVFKYRQKEKLTLQEAFDKASVSANYYVGKLSPARLKTAIKKSLSFYLQKMKFEEIEGIETIFLSDSNKYKFGECIKSVNNPSSKILDTIKPQGLFSPVESFNEYVILCEVEFIETDTGEITTLKLKGKLDNFTIDHDMETVTLNDLKSSGRSVDYFMGKIIKTTDENGEEILMLEHGSFQKYHYYRQLGMYTWLLQSAIKHIYNLDYNVRVNILAVETIPEFNNAIFNIGNSHIKEGIKELKELLTLVVEWKKIYQI